MKKLRPVIVFVFLIGVYESAFAQWRFGAQANASKPANKNYLINLSAGKEKKFSPNLSLVKSMVFELSENNHNYYFMNDEYLFKYDIDTKQINLFGMLSTKLNYKYFFFEFSFFGGLSPYNQTSGSEQFSDYTLKSTPEELQEQRDKLNEIRNPETLISGFKMLKAGTLINAGVSGNLNDKLSLSLIIGLRQELSSDRLLITSGISISRRAPSTITQ